MKSYIMTIEDDSTGIPLIIEAEVCAFDDRDMPEIVIQDISYGEKTIEQWTISESYRTFLKSRILHHFWIKE